MSHFTALLKSKGLLARKEQADYANAVSSALDSPGRIAFLQAETGVGKSLGYCVPAMLKLAREENARVIISSNSIALLRQLNQKEIPLAIDIAGEETGFYASHALLLGKHNFIAKDRLESAVAQMSQDVTKEHQEKIDILRSWDQPIDLFIQEYGELPGSLSAERICQTSYSTSDIYEIQRDSALDADILVCSHSMLVNDIILHGSLFFGGKNAEKSTYLIVDEADLLHSMLVQRQQHRFNLVDLKHAMSSFAKKPLIKKMNTMINEVRDASSGRAFLTSSTVQSRTKDHLRELIKDLKAYAEDEAKAIKSHLESILKMTLNSMGIGVSPILHEPSIVFVNPFFPRVFESYVLGHYTSSILTSGTLSTFNDADKGTLWIRRGLGVRDENTGLIEQFSPERFGKLKMTLAGPDFPPPFVYQADAEISDQWIKEVACHVKTLKGPVLILTGSHLESQLLRESLDGGIVHQYGERLDAVVMRYMSSGEQYLITAGGKVGLDIRGDQGEQYLQHVVLTRIPFQPRDEGYERELSNYIKVAHPNIRNPDAFVKTSHYMLSVNSAIRLTKQSLGRGIRHPDDEIEFHIMDRRFPLYNQVGSKHKVLKTAIPQRFMSEYDNATILKAGSLMEDIAIW